MYRFSPQIMHLGENLYVADLSPTKSYWEKQAAEKGVSSRELLKKVALTEGINHFFMFCDHPFRGLVFLQSLSQKQQGGCFFMDSLFSMKSYKNIGWVDWMMAVRRLEGWFDDSHHMVKERKNFSTQLGRFERFLQRMGLESITDLKEAQFYEVQRRFQQFLGLVWKWTFEKPLPDASAQQSFNFFEQQQASQKLLGFPWAPFHLFESPVRENLLEFPLSTWGQIEGELRKDLEVLSGHKGVCAPFQVMGFMWSIVLYDGDECHSPVDFNYPLCLQQDKEQDFSVTLKQLSFCFEQLKFQLEEKSKESDGLNVPFILGWKLKVSRIVYNKKVNTSLLPDVRLKQSYKEDLIELQNKLSSPMKAYRVNSSHVPSWDFSERDLDKELEEKFSKDERGLQKRVSQKPLFLFHTALEFCLKEIESKKFLERTSSDWWHSQNSEDHFRDYYICQLKSGDIIWAYRNFQGRWFKHGLYS